MAETWTPIAPAASVFKTISPFPDTQTFTYSEIQLRSNGTENRCLVSPKWLFNKAIILGIASHKACLVSHPPSRSDISIKEIWLLSERGFAILQAGRVRLSGLGAWLAWTGIHIQFLPTTSLRLSVLLQWIWSFVTGQTGVRIIVDHVPIFKPSKSVEAPIISERMK
jgi:hypothetical protein